jgi:glycosyltransferase involved in cell wall biosynthesis
VIIPLLDERASIDALLRSLAAFRAPWPAEIVFVDGGSTDGTVEAIAARALPAARTLVLPRGSGLAAAWRAGLAAAEGSVRVTMDGDGAHAIEDAIPLVEAVLAGADLVIARRYGPRGSGMPGRTPADRAASRAAAVVWSWRHRLPLWDPLHGFRARSARLVTALADELRSVSGNVWMGHEARAALARGLVVTERPVRYGRRIAGQEHKSLALQGLHFARGLWGRAS